MRSKKPKSILLVGTPNQNNLQALEYLNGLAPQLRQKGYVVNHAFSLEAVNDKYDILCIWSFDRINEALEKVAHNFGRIIYLWQLGHPALLLDNTLVIPVPVQFKMREDLLQCLTIKPVSKRVSFTNVDLRISV